MGYKFTMYPCNNQACIKEKHFKFLLSPALAKWAWLQRSLVPWPPVPCIPAAGSRSLHSHPTPAAPSNPGHSPRGAVFTVGGWRSSGDPNLSLPCHHTGKVRHKPKLSSCSLSAPSSCGHQRAKASQRQGEKEWKQRWDGFSLVHLKFILHSSLWEELVNLMCPQHSE